MDIFKLLFIEDYWKLGDIYPTHEITNLMSLFHFQKISRMISNCFDLFYFKIFWLNYFFLIFYIKRYLHISDITKQTNIFSKLKPLASHVRNISKKLYIPASNVAIDEMIAQFSDRSAHTFRIKNKPTPKEYKILSLCDSSYTYTFMFISRVEISNVDVIESVNKLAQRCII